MVPYGAVGECKTAKSIKETALHTEKLPERTAARLVSDTVGRLEVGCVD